jgi:FixJ family two-component response regulator
MTGKATVVVVDDDPAVRDALTLMLEEQDYAVTTFASAETFLASCPPVTRGCAIIDVRMPGMDGMQLRDELLKRHIALPVIFLTGHGDIPLSVRAIKAGAVDFLTKPVTVETLLRVVQAALLENERLKMRSDVKRTAMASAQSLTQREREIMTMVVQGLANKEIARQLGISHRTVEQHRATAMRKMGAGSLVDLIRAAEQSGLPNVDRPT